MIEQVAKALADWLPIVAVAVGLIGGIYALFSLARIRRQHFEDYMKRKRP